MEAKEQAAQMPIAFKQDSGKPFWLDRWKVTLWAVRGKVRVELVDLGPHLSRPDIDGDPESGSI
jgi:hypothetical protein